MTSIPENAQRSEDGHWWWDETQQQWQPVAGAAVSAATAAASTAASTAPAGGADPAASATYAEAQGEIPVSMSQIELTDQEISEIMQRAGVTEEPNV